MDKHGDIIFSTRTSETHYREPREIMVAHAVEEVVPALERVARRVDDGLHAAGFLAYEAAPAFDDALTCHDPGGAQLLWFGLYDRPTDEPDLSDDATAPELDWHPLVDAQTYETQVEKLRELIAAGDTYQVNYTFPMDAPFDGDARAWFHQLCRAQEADYCAYVDTGQCQILSLSPELLFDLEDGVLTTRPMKGTRPRGLWCKDDKRLAKDLAESPKDRAENLMIVDLLRNDVGRVSEVGSVNVPALFEVERYPTVWQMTSTVQSRTAADVPEVLAALFPSGSVTGAPKVHTMEIIGDAEPHSRGVYCGAVGWWKPGNRARFNVAIRTITVDTKQRRARYHVGSGITWDSAPAVEYDECLTKARFLSATRPDVDLIEALRYDGEYFLLEGHLARLRDSAAYFGFAFEESKLLADLLREAETHNTGAWKVRVLLNRSGDATITWESVEDLDPLRVGLASEPVCSEDVFLFHKTTQREVYEQAMAARPDCDDVLLWNERGELTESTRANIVVELNGHLVTPPIRCGLLGGIYRAHLIERGELAERVIRKDELLHAPRLWLINSVRKRMDVAEILDHAEERPCVTP